MDFKFGKGSSDAPQQEPHAEKKNQNALLVLLLLLVGGFSYIYFFTGLIKQPDVPKPAVVAAPQVEKMPLPARDGASDAVETKAKEPKTVAVPTKAQPVNAVQPPAVAAVAPAAKVPAQPPAKSKEVSDKTGRDKPVEKKALPVQSADKKELKTVVAKVDDKKSVAEKKQVPAEKIAGPVVKSVDKKGPAESPVKPNKAAKSPIPASKDMAGKAWTILVGNYVLEEALSTDLGRVRKAGFEPVVQAGARKKTTMTRLMLDEFTSRDEAQATIVKLKRHTSDAFIIDQGGKYVVYAGSYLLDVRAASEKERLVAAGFPVTLKRVEIAIPSQSLTVGSFSDKKTADAAIIKLKSAGIKATLLQQ